MFFEKYFENNEKRGCNDVGGLLRKVNMASHVVNGKAASSPHAPQTFDTFL
ncbi:MAG: hypothetical protein IJW55_09300 [Clostridia bacterium]|nr:hypothetical protein [Clostridia bacterium]